MEQTTSPPSIYLVTQIPERPGEGGNPGYSGDDEDLWDNLPSMGHQGAMHVLSMDSPPVFSGSEDNREASYQWM
ncbi:hypothetical protein H257_15456 [Aphanomyces astaci]|uniref:Uncharacterized protein n=1 Tax=Aphanomyces astaci TaxID=112090 RepID=W4FMF7_APHAT|nr:hypothetical protein H257_15456 [Aphanomyces astaci]ETV68650.1 hypothetical protein H257_15456 [Aphanomyces astaci]|eukprot:XP_009841875.1 hypothetical protein H257_15456 [Aphanomyces astaci]